MDLLQVINLLSGFVLLVTAFFVIRKRKADRYVRPFLFFIFVNLLGILAAGIETGQNPSLWSFGYILLFFYISFLPSAWYWLGSRWGLDDSEQRPAGKIILRGTFLVSAVFFISLSMTRGIDLTLLEKRWYLDLGGWYFWLGAFLIVCVTAGMYAIETCYRSSLGLTREKIKKSFSPLLAYGVGLLAAATVAVLYHQVSDLMLVITYLLAALVALIVMRHYMIFNPADDGVILTRKGIYSSIVIVIVGIYFLVIGLVGELLVKYNLNEGLFFSVAVLILLVVTFMLLVVSQAIRSRLKAVSSPPAPVSGKGVYAEEWKEFTEEVSVILNLDAIYDCTSRLLHRLMKIDRIVFVVRETAPSENFALYSGDGIDRGIPGDRLQLLSDWLYRFAHPVEVVTLREKASREAEELTALEKSIPFELFLLVPFVARQQFLGFWGIGRHSSGRDLTSHEIGFIEAAANPVALTILSARMTDELVVSREIESFHRISSFVLHDLKNSVGMLSMLLQNAERNIDNPEFQKEAMVTITRAVDRQKKIISRLTGQKIDDKLSFEKVDLAGLIRKTLNRIKFDTLKSIELRFDIDEGTFVIVDPEKIESVFDNLVMNAVEAMPEGGRLEIKLSQNQPPGMVAVSFRDTGPGMEPEFISTRLFKPFRSTKPHGLGIGMYQSREIIKAHRGKIEVTSKPGAGAEFVIYLPGEE